jgi:carbonic anhydrase
VLKKEAGMSVTQYEAFRGILGNNFRPLQDRNDRVITKTRDH